MLREAIRETAPILPANLIYPLFVYDHVQEPDTEKEIASMPGVRRHSIPELVAEVGEAIRYGVKQVVVFPKTPDSLKTRLGEESANPEGLAQTAIRELKKVRQEVPSSLPQQRRQTQTATIKPHPTHNKQ